MKPHTNRKPAKPSQWVAKPKLCPSKFAEPSQAKPRLYNKYTTNGVLLEDKGGALFYQQYTLLFYQLADDTMRTYTYILRQGRTKPSK